MFNMHIAHYLYTQMETVLNGYWKGLDAQTMEMLQTSFLAKYVCDCDIHLYSSILNAVHSESLSCAASEDQSIGGKHCDLLVSFFDHWLNAALATVPEVLRVTKLQVAKCFTLSLHRATALMTSAYQANALLNSDYLLHQMVADWGKLDMENINEYVGWSCQWQEDFLFAVENDIVSLLHRKASLSNWTTWLNSLIQRSVNFPMVRYLRCVSYSSL